MDLALKNISVGYGSRILAEGLSETFPEGTLTAITGRNGTGKSTLLRAMAGLGKLISGNVLVEDVDIFSLRPRELARLVGFVSTERVRATNLRVRDMVALGRTPHTDWTGRLTPSDRAAVDDALCLVGMCEMADKQLDTLSDGEAQRVMIARVLAQDTPIVLLDEPTAFLDFVARREIVELLAGLARDRRKIVVFSSHELDLVREFTDCELKLGDF